jgi:secondary thiamine-phosphate synthase enzyme
VSPASGAPRRIQPGPYDTPVRELRVTTSRRSQLVEITRDVGAAVRDQAGSAVLVYVPHTTAGVTINERIDPELLGDFERALERIVEDGWRWVHDDADGPNAPAHLRASLVGAQVLVPLRDGALALGRYQGIFFCEFDGPRERSVYVTVLR